MKCVSTMARLLHPLSLLFALSAVLGAAPPNADEKKYWPQPPIVAPQYDGKEVPAPEGAIILFGGKDVSAWIQLPTKERPFQTDGPILWKIEDGYLEVVGNTGMIRTKEKVITSGHLHIEWATPQIVTGEGQGRGNSGVFIDGIPKIQVLDSFENMTYPDGHAAAFYRQHPPLVNASRGPGLWQSFDIHIQRAKVVDGQVTEPATVTVYHNNVLVQDRVKFINPVTAGTLRLQDKPHPCRFRNIWFLSKP
jgi:hypothetical protein